MFQEGVFTHLTASVRSRSGLKFEEDMVHQKLNFFSHS